MRAGQNPSCPSPGRTPHSTQGTLSRRRAGDVMGSLYQTFITLAHGRAVRLLGEGPQAEQVACDAILKLWESHAHSDRATQAAFVYRSVTNLALNALRAGVRMRELEGLKSLQHRAPAAACAAVETLRDILAQVSYDEAQIAAYYYIDGLEHDEIGTLLHIEVRTVQARLHAFEARAARLRHLTSQRIRHVA